MKPWVGRYLGFLKPDESQTLQVRLFRIFTGITALSCLVSILPLTVFESAPWLMDVAVLFLGLFGAICYALSLRGRILYYGYFAALLMAINLLWFLDAGAAGGISFCFFPILLYPMVTFRGRALWLAYLFLLLDFLALTLIDYVHPSLHVPYASTRDSLVDHLVTGIACTTGLALMVRLVLSAYESDQKKISAFAKEMLAKDESFRAIFNSTMVGLFIYSEDLTLIDTNNGASAMFQCSKDALLGKPQGSGGSGFTPAEQPELRGTLLRALKEDLGTVRWHARKSNGGKFWAELYLYTATMAGGRRLVVAVRDISGRVAAEEGLRLNEERLRMALAASNQGWFDIDVQTGEGTASGEYARILGMDPVDFEVNKQSWLEGIHAEDRDMMASEFAACVATGGPRVMEYRRRGRDGEWKWIRSVGKIVEWDRAGRAVRMIGTHADVTERKRLEVQLLHSQRLESVGTLAGGVAHDLNNILTPMLMAGPAIREKLANPEDQALMAQMEAGARRGASIVKQLLAFSRDLEEARVSVDTLQILREMKSIMQAIFPRSIDIVTSIEGDLWPVKADPVQFHQVLMNLCINARDAMPQGGRLTLSARNEEVAGASLARSVVITVADTGQGIARENLGRIFDPFFTTKEIGKGTGLGLSVVHGILKSHGGSITVDSEPGRGSTFRVVLPASGIPPSAAPGPARIQEQPVNRRPVVVVVDDEPLVLRVTVRALERQGYDLISAQRGDEALRLIEQRTGPLDLLLTDIMMPDMDGPTLVTLLRKTHPTVKVIGVSGLNLEHRGQELAAIGFSEVLRKPYDLSDLLGAVRRHLPASLNAAGAARN